MGSLATTDVTVSDAVVPKVEHHHDRFSSRTPSSSPELDGDDIDLDHRDSGSHSQHDPPPIPKRKGGRKPIYATSEERKQRNRQAQAAFRERRTEYIKQLETTIQRHEEALQSLQQSHRTAADECLMLRYKNSLLERILLEKGIDVQAELRLKGSPHLRPVGHRAVAGQASPMQKAMLNRQQQVRQRPVVPPPIQTVNLPSSSTGNPGFQSLPRVQPTPPSQQSSPSTSRSPGFALQGGMVSPPADLQAQQMQQRALPTLQHQNTYPSQHRHHMRSMSATTANNSYNQARMLPTTSMHSGYYPTNNFQKHYEQLDQEYDTQADMIDEMDADDLDADNFIPNFQLPTTVGQGPHMAMQTSPPMTSSATSDSGGGVNMIDPFDPMLDADPFGLTASMHFPNPYPFPPTQPRR